MSEEYNDYAEVGTCPNCGGHMLWSMRWQCWVMVCCEEADLNDEAPEWPQPNYMD